MLVARNAQFTSIADAFDRAGKHTGTHSWRECRWWGSLVKQAEAT